MARDHRAIGILLAVGVDDVRFPPAHHRDDVDRRQRRGRCSFGPVLAVGRCGRQPFAGDHLDADIGQRARREHLLELRLVYGAFDLHGVLADVARADSHARHPEHLAHVARQVLAGAQREAGADAGIAQLLLDAAARRIGVDGARQHRNAVDIVSDPGLRDLVLRNERLQEGLHVDLVVAARNERCDHRHRRQRQHRRGRDHRQTAQERTRALLARRVGDCGEQRVPCSFVVATIGDRGFAQVDTLQWADLGRIARVQWLAFDADRRIERAQGEAAADQGDQRMVRGHAGVGEHDVAILAAADHQHFLLGQAAARAGVQAGDDAQHPARGGPCWIGMRSIHVDRVSGRRARVLVFKH